MIFLWSTNNKIGSRLIRWGLDEPSSHFAVCFFEDSFPTVIESRLDTGVREIGLKEFSDVNTIVHALQAPVTLDEEILFFNDIKNKTSGVGYDFPAILYWTYVGFMRKLFGIKQPRINIMDRSELLYCVEILELLDDYLQEIGVDTSDVEYGMLSPEQAYVMLCQCENLRSLPC